MTNQSKQELRSAIQSALDTARAKLKRQTEAVTKTQQQIIAFEYQLEQLK